MVLSNTDGNFEYVNPALLNMLGYSEQEIYQDDIIISHPDDAEINTKIRDRLQSDPFTPITIEKRYIHKSGRIVYGLLTMVAQPTETGGVKRFIAQITDLTDKKQSENTRLLFRKLIDCSNDGILVIDPINSRFIDANTTVCQNLGYSYQEMLTLSVIDIETMLPNNFSWQTHVGQVKRSNGIVLEGEHKRKDGTTYPAEISVNYVTQNGNNYMIAIIRNITERKANEKTIWQQANFDSLTGLANRCMLHNSLSECLKKSRRTGLCVAVLCIDLDHFKDVNDHFGHAHGDKILQEVATRIRACVRDTDIVARVGGDEFTVVISDIENDESTIRVANKIIENLSQPFSSGLIKSYISASIGIAFHPKDTNNADLLLKYADQAMYVAKSLGRKRYHLFNLSIQASINARSWLNVELRESLNQQDFHLIFQPIIDLKTGKCNRAEALLRWTHPEKGSIDTNDFIAAAEENGMICDIGDWVFYKVSQQLKIWREMFGNDFQISVNTSPIQLRNFSHNLKKWCQHLEKMNLAGSGIIIELTEGTIMDLNKEANEVLSLFRNKGMEIAIDDFGTGYSSLAYLKKLDVDYVKIDQSFVKNLTKNLEDVALCEAIIILAHKLKLKVIAEGIETIEQAEKLAAIGCDFGQGFYFSKGVIACSFEHYLQSKP
jgi:diguanylate cyclase (GGDEF)-like protein/PAS domain S-box-containing protein